MFFFSLLLSPLLSGISWPLHRRRQTKKYPTKQKQTEMQETILSVLSDKKKSEEGKEEEELELVVPPPCRTRSLAGSRRVTPMKMMDPRMARP
jgi:hypothetical protein